MRRFDFVSGVPRPPAPVLPPDIFLGIDWGRETPTSLCILRSYDQSLLKVDYDTVFSEDIQTTVENITRRIEILGPKMVLADIGFGAVQVQLLQQRFGDIVRTCFYGTNTNAMNYNAQNWMLTVNRDESLRGSQFLVEKTTPLDDSRRHALNYAYLAYTMYLGIQAGRNSENTLRVV
jgi:hypothetical protein